jgi:hypothetical protein
VQTIGTGVGVGALEIAEAVSTGALAARATAVKTKNLFMASP